MSADDTLNDARHEVLVENTAQAVHKHLSKLFQEEIRFRSRWVWELLQNARDASPEEGVSVWLIQEPHRVVFRHNGVPFAHKSIAHLIYHGSTKYDISDSSAIGQFGTGFLTTHLISKTVEVKGRTDGGRQFRFLLDRRGNNADELKAAMDASWEAFTQSLTEGPFNDDGGFTTEFAYPLVSDIVGVVEEGIADLITNAAYLLAFNGRIRSLHVEQLNRSVTIKKGVCRPISEAAHRLQVEEGAPGDAPVSRYVAFIANDETSVAVEIAGVGANWSIAEQGQIPRIFVAFPLTGTRDFCFPVVINNEKFQPREDRDTLVLIPNREGKHLNMVRMEGACDFAARLAVLAAEEGWRGAATLARLYPLHQWDWVDTDWFRKLLVERFIEPLRAAKVMMTAAGARIAPSAGMIPLFADPEACCDLWDLTAEVKDALGQLPRRDEAHTWADNLKSWAPFLPEAVEQLSESLTLQKLCEQVSAWGTVEEVGKQLGEAVDPIAWLNQLHTLISKTSHVELFEQARLIPSQGGALKKITELRRDSGIDEELKDIAESLGLPTRDDLLDQRMRLKEFLELQPKTEGEVLTAAAQALKDKAKSVDAAFGRIAVRFFVWLVRHDKTDRLDGFPVLTRATTKEDAGLATLFRDPAKSDERLLAPIGCWPEPARLVADLFPKRLTLSDMYHEALADEALWRGIADKGYVRLNPLFKTQRRHIPFIPDEPLPVSEKDKKLKHRTKDSVEVSALAFFEKDETGLDAVRRSKTRAVSLLLFLATHVLEVDSDALDTVEADCECGEKHHHYRAAWLVPMWDRQWVPLGDAKQSSATAESIAQLFVGREEELRQLTAGKGRKLLEALNISLADLSLRAVAKDEDTRISLIDSLTDIVHAAENDLEKIRLVAGEIKQSPGLLDEIREHRERREKVQRNQSFGAEVERLLKEALQGHGLKVTRTGVGSDYEVEEDYLVDDKEVILEVENGHRSFLVEVKATVGKVAKMTVTQAETAVHHKDRFILCIVRLDSPDTTLEIVQERCRFVMNIGHQIEPVLEEYRRYQETRDEACTRVGEVELIVHDSEVRFAVGDGAWTSGLSLHDVVERILRACSGTVSAT
ncbi:histidine kinase [Sulfurifustis variabilis]|uniref:Histidine kinase n=1 Tax=Sulfurifustis variabilis TaxID=1675686 RepID=A0A1B4V7R8_9GAMM|nr:ATP-binding protein [Sulfurifustis variabilis]BAU49573.1 histidine kinase [Sulfurifustis variabilis]